MNKILKVLLSKKPLTAFYMLCVLIALAAPAAAVPFNVTQGKNVTVTGAIGVITCCWSDASVYPPASLSSLVDGAYVAEETEWQTGTVWWDERHPGSAGNIIEIDLNGRFLISFLSIQADNNDEYGVSARDRFGIWSGLTTFGSVSGFGMHERHESFIPFEATAFQINASGGDQFYSVSEFQATGEAVPEPGSLLLLAIGIGLVALRLRQRMT